MMEKILNLLYGKKTTIMAILGLIVVFLLGEGFIDKLTADLISGILVILGGGANIATARIKRNEVA